MRRAMILTLIGGVLVAVAALGVNSVSSGSIVNPPQPWKADVDGNGAVNISDAIQVVYWIGWTGVPAGPVFGDGSDGPATFSSDAQFNPPVDAAVVAGSMGTSALTVSGASGAFQPGQKILVSDAGYRRRHMGNQRRILVWSW